MSADILVVEDEEAIREMVGLALTRNNYRFRQAEDAEQARTLINERFPDLILLDWMLPGTSGIELARQLKDNAATRHLPIIMLTARAEEDDKVNALEAGADDYVTKPFSPRELLARIKSVLRRAAPHTTEDIIKVGGLVLDPVSHRLQAGTDPINLGPTEFRLLRFFMTHPERVYSRAQLLDMVWGNNIYVEERTVDVHIRRLRKALQASGHDTLVQTVRGEGYRFSVMTNG
jgi:two-component system phosphate regulon response regulator PhoB